MNSNDFFKNIKYNKTFLITGFMIILLSFLLGGYFIIYHKDSNPVPLASVNEENTFAEVDVELVSNYFATEEHDGLVEKFYIIYDEEYLYIAKIDDKTFAVLQDIYEYSYSEDENAIVPETVNILGYSKVIPNEVYNYAKDFLNKEELNESEFRNYVGYFYLDTSSVDNNSLTLVLFIGFFVFFGIILIMIYFFKSHKIKKILNSKREEIDKICMDIDAGNALFYKFCRTYLTNDYIVNYSDGLEIFNYEDIIWIYPSELHQNGIVTQKSINLIINNGKSYSIANVSAWSRKSRIDYNKFYQELMSKLPNALHGYSKENQNKAKEKYVKR